jgi:amino acid transporter
MAQGLDEGTIDVSSGKYGNMLQSKAVGLIGVLFLTVTGAAPMSAMLGNVPFGAGSGNGLHMPAAFALATIVLTIFSIGYAAMATRISSVGGFYTFITQGLGREVGLSAGITSLVSYSIFEASLYGLFAFFGTSWVKNHFGLDISWPWFAFFAVVLAAVLSYRDVKLSAAILGVALILEVLMLAIFAIGVLTAKSGTSFTTESLNIFHVTQPVVEQKVGDVAIGAGLAAVGIFMAFWSWVGFEMAPNYAEESRDPKSIVPKSLYFSVIGLGVFYTFVSWCAVSAYPSEGDMLAKAVGDSSNFFLGPIETFVGTWAKELMGLLILTSSFACGMAFHNTASRYMYSLGREGVLPASLGTTHADYKSPYRASLVQSVLAAIWILLFVVFMGSNDPSAQAYVGVYTMLAVLGTALLLILQAVVSIAIMVYFNRHGGGSAFSTMIAPGIAFLSQAYLVYLLFSNITILGGSAYFFSIIPWISLAIIVAGLIWAFVLKSANPAAYKNIGHMVNNG